MNNSDIALDYMLSKNNFIFNNDFNVKLDMTLQHQLINQLRIRLFSDLLNEVYDETEIITI